MSNTKINNTLSGLRGRFFGLTTKQGEVLNSQLVKVTPQYIVVNDRNHGISRKFAKSSVKSITVGGQKYA